MNKPALIFIAYSKEDKDLLDHFRRHLSALERNEVAKIWYDGEIEAGANWEDSIKNALQQADIILLMVSAGFLASDSCYDGEMAVALQLHEKRQAKVIPIILKNCLWEQSPFAQLQVLPNNKKAIVSDSEVKINDCFAEIVKELAGIIAAHVQPNHKNGTAFSETGLFTDPRDGKVYPAKEIAGKIWLAKNVDFDIGEGSWSYHDQGNEHIPYGRLYTWEAAQKACPPGWKLPDTEDWEALIQYFGEGYMAYKHLLQGGDSGLDMLPGGKYSTFSGQLVLVGTDAFYWTGNAANFEEATYYMFDKGMGALRKNAVRKKTGASVRCVWKGE